ncbi:hypothetical protein [Undibacterium sp.]|uniref:hypothetical protein n=1 Tax=Undibacterium sp. TaxID=1914977 RepID=UPI00374D96AE
MRYYAKILSAFCSRGTGLIKAIVAYEIRVVRKVLHKGLLNTFEAKNKSKSKKELKKPTNTDVLVVDSLAIDLNGTVKKIGKMATSVLTERTALTPAPERQKEARRAIERRDSLSKREPIAMKLAELRLQFFAGLQKGK